MSDLYFKEKKEKFKKKLNKFKPQLKIDFSQKFEKEPVQKVEDRAPENKGIDQTDVEGIIKEIKKEWKIEDTLEDYDLIRKLGQGAFGEVWKVKHKVTGKISARKEIALESNSGDMNPRAIGSELLGLWKSKHEQVIRLESFFYKAGKIHMLLEYMNCTDIEKVMKVVKVYPERVISQVMRQILAGLAHLHDKLGIVHRDIKPGNLLINDKGQCKIADFGMAGMKKKIFTTFVGTMVYMSPERIRGETHGFNSDNWSIGLSAAEMALGEYPLKINADVNLFDMLGHIEGIIRGKKLLPAGKFSKEFIDFVDCCMKIEKEERWEASKLLEHPFIKKYEGAKPSFRSWLHQKYIKVKKQQVLEKKKKEESKE